MDSQWAAACLMVSLCRHARVVSFQMMGALRSPSWPWSLQWYLRGKRNHTWEEVFSVTSSGICMLLWWFNYNCKPQITQWQSVFSKYLLVVSGKWTPPSQLQNQPSAGWVSSRGQELWDPALPLPSTTWGHSQSHLSSVLAKQLCASVNSVRAEDWYLPMATRKTKERP